MALLSKGQVPGGMVSVVLPAIFRCQSDQAILLLLLHVPTQQMIFLLFCVATCNQRPANNNLREEKTLGTTASGQGESG